MRSTQVPRLLGRRRWPVALGLLVALGALTVGPWRVSASPAAKPMQRAQAESVTACLDSLRKLEQAHAYYTNLAVRARNRQVFLIPDGGIYFPIERSKAQQYLTMELFAGTITAHQLVAWLRYLTKQTAVGIDRLEGWAKLIPGRVSEKAQECAALQRQPIVSGGPTTVSGATFTLDPGLTKIVNPWAPGLEIDAAAGTAALQHCCVAGGSDISYTFKVPQTLTPGTTAHVTLGIVVSSVTAKNATFNVGMKVLAPQFTDVLAIAYPQQTSGSKTFDIPIPASLSSAKELTIEVDIFESSYVVYTYRP